MTGFPFRLQRPGPKTSLQEPLQPLPGGSQRGQRLTHWLTETWPRQINTILRWLSPWQMLLLFSALALLSAPLITTETSLPEQGLVALLLIGLGALVQRLEDRHAHQAKAREYLHLFMVVLSSLTTVRYLYYRTRYTLNLDTRVDAVFSILLFLAELYALGTLFLSYFQTLTLRKRKSVDLAQWPQESWPTVDIYIPTYNEEVEIVRKTALAAQAVDYPKDKMRVYVLDDGRKFPERRADLARMCEDLGCTMLTRDNNDHAKAGNINTALKRTEGDLVMILDCDHIPVRGFLQETVGFFYDTAVALVQTPHWFYNPDPFERNLLTQGQVPVGNELFYKVLQKGNDAWNAAFFCGSAAVVRRQYLLEIGGIATETVTEDCHTSLRLHSLGYKTIYYDQIMVAGLAPEKFSAYVGQQVRWARGMAQILRLENPLFNRKLNLTLPQRVCYFSATSHFFFGFPRLMYAIAPNLFLLFSINSVKGLGLETLLYALPHIALSMQTNHIPYKHVRFSFWNEIYEFSLSFQAGIVTLLALINPKLGSFNVTAKGLKVNERNFDLDSVRYLVVLGVITGASLLAVPFWLILSPEDSQAVLINALWCTFNLVLVLSACLVAFEQPQLRRAHRLPRVLTAIVHSDDQSWQGKTVNVSESGAQVLLDEWPNVPDQVRVELVGDYEARVLVDAQIVRAIATSSLQTLLSLDFIDLSQTQADDLSLVIYSDVREWYSQRRSNADRPFDSLRFIATSLSRVFSEFKPESATQMRKQVRGSLQLIWDGWSGQRYEAEVLEISTRDLRLELSDLAAIDIDTLRQDRPLLGLLFFDARGNAISLLAQVTTIDVLSPRLVWLEGTAFLEDPKVSLELAFPLDLDRQQRSKIRALLKVMK